MKRKIVALAVVVAMLAVAIVSSTMAYFTDTDNAVNVMTMGNVSIVQNETLADGVTPFADGKQLVPAVIVGGTVNNAHEKVVTVTNSGKSAAYVRTLFAFEDSADGTLADQIVPQWKDSGKVTWLKDADDKFVIINVEGVTYRVADYTYDAALAAGDTTDSSLLGFYLAPEATNETVEALGSEYKILVLSQAVQAAGFGSADVALDEAFAPMTADNKGTIEGWFFGMKSTWNGAADNESLDANTNTESKTVLIEDAAQLAAFRDAVNAGNTYSGYTVTLAANIHLNGAEWTPIGPNADAANKFAGTFDGAGYTIYGLNVNQGADYHAAGLFGSLNGTVKNLTIDGATVTSLSSGDPTDNGTAVLAGSLYNIGSVDNVTVKNATVNGNRYVGGIAGYVYGNITNCTVEDSTITAAPDNLGGSYNNGDKVGAIAGYFSDETTFVLKNNTVENVTLKAYRDVGGIVGSSTNLNRISGNTVENTTIIQDNTNGYKSSVDTYGEIYGRYTANGTIGEGNTYDNVTLISLSPAANGYSTDNEGNWYIYDEEGLESLHSYILTGNNSHTVVYGMTVNIMEDIDADGYTWNSINITPHGTDSDGIIIDGNGNTISNMNINGSMFTSMPNAFGDSAEPGYVKDLTFDNITVTGGHDAAVVWGQNYSDLVLDNVHVKNSTLTANCNVGALVGRTVIDDPSRSASVVIKNCSVENCTFTANGETGADPIGANAFVGRLFGDTTLTFSGNNTASGNTFTNNNGLAGGNIYTHANVVSGAWVIYGTYGFENCNN